MPDSPGPGRLHDLFVTLEAVTPGEYKSRGRGLTLWFGTAQSPFGEALIVRSARGIAFLAFADENGVFDGFDDFRATWRDADWEQDDAGAKQIAGHDLADGAGAPTASSRSGCMAATSSCRCGARCSRRARAGR